MKNLSKSKIFLFAMVGFCAGVFISPYIGGFLSRIPIIVTLLNCYIVILLLLSLKFPKILKIFIILLIMVLIGVWRYQVYLPKINEGHVAYYNDNKEEYLIEGIIDTEPAEGDSSLKLQISNVKFQINDKFQIQNEENKITSYQDNNPALRGKILLTIPKYFDAKYGDSVRFNAKLTKPTSFDTFDYAAYLSRYGVYSIAKSLDGFTVVANYANSNEPASPAGRLSRMDKISFFIVANLINIKNHFSSIINKILPEPHAGLMLGILLGAKTSLPDWLINIFKLIWITHIIANSGYNITILAKVAEGTLGKIGRKYIFWGVLAMILAFVIMTGASASVVRAGVMGFLLVYAGFIGRKSNITNALVLAGTIMILLNPLILRNDIGFQLSFLATLGLVYISPIFDSVFKKVPEFFRVLLSATLAAQVLTLPILISNFSLISLISPLANIIILPFIPISMFLGFTTGLVGMIYLPLGQLIGFFSYIVLDAVIKISQFLASIPYAAVEVKMNNWVVWGGYYVAVGVLILLWHKKNNNQIVIPEH